MNQYDVREQLQYRRRYRTTPRPQELRGKDLAICCVMFLGLVILFWVAEFA